MTCKLLKLVSLELTSYIFCTSFYFLFLCRYEAGLLFAYLAFVPFCEAGIMDCLSLQVHYNASKNHFFFYPSCSFLVVLFSVDGN